MPAGRNRTSTSCPPEIPGSGRSASSRTPGPPTAVINTARKHRRRFASSYSVHSAPIAMFSMVCAPWRPAPAVSYLGVVFNQAMSMEYQL